MLKVHGAPNTRTFRVMWLLEELGLEYQLIPTTPGSPEAKAINPSAKVPVMVSDGVTIADSTAIMTYLADREGRLTAPAGTMARAQQDSVTNFLLDEMDACIWTAARHSFVLPKEMRLPEVKESLRWEFARAEARLAQRMRGPFLMGDEMTVPDIIAVHCLNWAVAAKFPLADTAVAEYAEGMRSRPAYLRARGE